MEGPSGIFAAGHTASSTATAVSLLERAAPSSKLITAVASGRPRRKSGHLQERTLIYGNVHPDSFVEPTNITLRISLAPKTHVI